MRRVLLAVLLGCLVLINWCYADTTWVNSGVVSGVWTAEHSPYIILGNITVSQSDTLQIEPGVSVIWRAIGGLTVNGRIAALGTESDSVHFRSTAGYQWLGITLSTTAAPAHFEYCAFDFKYDGITGTRIPIGLYHCALRGVAGNYALQLSGPGGALEMSDCVVEHNRQPMYSAGILLDAVQAVLTDCIIRDNGNGTMAGGIYIREMSNVSLNGCIISGNRGGKGGGISVASSSRLTMNHCVVSGDSAYGGHGSGLYVMGDSRLIMNDCMVIGNVLDGNLDHTEGGAGLGGSSRAEGSLGSYVALNGCLFGDNRLIRNGTSAIGGAIRGCDTLIIDHSTITRNRAGNGSAIATANLVLKNSIVADNPTERATNCEILAGSLNMAYSDFKSFGHRVYGGSTFPGFQVLSQVNANGDSCDMYFNLFRDPLFVDSAAGDFNLMAQSACIDAGDPASPLDPDGSVADMGAFPYAHPTSASPEAGAVPQSLALSAYPNPFNASVMLHYTLEQAGKVRLTVYDLLGREAATIASGVQQPGSYQHIWNAADLPSGIYVAVLRNGSQTRLQKLVLMK